MIKLKRAYEAASKNDGLRILVERLWPRGVSKAKGTIDRWLKEIAPSNFPRNHGGDEPKHRMNTWRFACQAVINANN